MTLSAFELCISPNDLQAFLERWWECEPLLISRREPKRFDRLMSRSIFDDLVAHTNLRVPFFRLIKDGKIVPEAACTTSRMLGPSRDVGLAHLDTLYDGFSNGTTVVLAALEKLHPALTQFCSELEAVFRCPIQAQASLAPPHAGELPPHRETHGIFVLQVEGTKRWRIWSDRWRSPDDNESAARFVEGNAPTMDFLLEPGASLYLPGGFTYAADASPVVSLHVAIEAKLLRWLDVIGVAAREALASLTTDHDAQRALALGRRPGEPIGRQDDAALAALTARLVAGLSADRLVALARSWSESPQSRDRSGALLRRLADEAASPEDHR
jgi:bifunctional lysine-specific demethylase and histidyl-hydroxylase NO66